MLEPLSGTLVRQCAWCWLVVDQYGAYRLQPGRKLKTATHGICPNCKAGMWAEIDGGSVGVRWELVAA